MSTNNRLHMLAHNHLLSSHFTWEVVNVPETKMKVSIIPAYVAYNVIFYLIL